MTSIFRRRMFWIAIGIPNILSFIYFGIVASPVFVSNASLLVFNSTQGSLNLTSLMSGTSDGESFEGAYILQKYIASWAEYQSLSAKFDLAQQYGNGDLVSRYGGLPTLFRRDDIALWKFYQKHAEAEVNEKTNIVTIQVKGYSPEFTAALGNQILSDTITHIDAMNEQLQHDYADNAEHSRTAIMANLEHDEAALADFRVKTGIFNPESHYSAQLNLLTSLEENKANLESQYQVLTGAAPNSPAASNALKGSAAIAEHIGATQSGFKTLAEQDAHYHTLTIARDNDAALLKEITTAVQQANLNSIKNKYYLEVISPISAPHSPELPRRFEWIAGIAIGTLLLWSLVR